MASIVLRLHVANPRPLCDRFLRFIVLCFLREKSVNNVAFRHRRNVYAARLMDMSNRQIALRERWCRQFAWGRKVSVYDSIIIIIMAGMAVD